MSWHTRFAKSSKAEFLLEDRLWLARGKVQEVGSKPKTCCSFPPRTGVDAARGRSCASPGAAWLEAAAAHTALAPQSRGAWPGTCSSTHPTPRPRSDGCSGASPVLTPKTTWETLGRWAPNRECTKALTVPCTTRVSSLRHCPLLRSHGVRGMAQLQA